MALVVPQTRRGSEPHGVVTANYDSDRAHEEGWLHPQIPDGVPSGDVVYIAAYHPDIARSSDVDLAETAAIDRRAAEVPVRMPVP